MDDVTATQDTVAAAELRQLIERIERLEEEKSSLHDEFHTCEFSS